ncbi:MAG: hypothetical protein HKM06_09240 [Spirochaetales bacterium]|nr:hypothetical protein [Spirochaetales bacterium]
MHNLARFEPQKGWADKAADLLQALTHKTLPEELEAILLPYWGSAVGIEARDDINPLGKLFSVYKSFGILDEAVSRYGAFSFYPQLIRAQVDWDVPSFFNRRPQAQADLQALMNWSETHHEKLPLPVRARVEFLWGMVQKQDGRLDQALAAWKAAVADDPAQTGPGKDAEEQLQRYQ